MAQHYDRKSFESSGRNSVNEKGSSSRKEKEKELVHRKRALTGRVKGLYTGTEQETFKKEGKQSVEKEGLPKVVRKLMGTGENWECEWEEEEGPGVGELGRRMVAEGWSMGEEALVKHRRVSW